MVSYLVQTWTLGTLVRYPDTIDSHLLSEGVRKVFLLSLNLANMSDNTDKKELQDSRGE